MYLSRIEESARTLVVQDVDRWKERFTVWIHTHSPNFPEALQILFPIDKWITNMRSSLRACKKPHFFPALFLWFLLLFRLRRFSLSQSIWIADVCMSCAVPSVSSTITCHVASPALLYPNTVHRTSWIVSPFHVVWWPYTIKQNRIK